MSDRCPLTGDPCSRLDCDPPHDCGAQAFSKPRPKPPQSFMLKQVDADLYINSDIDSSGMSVTLVQKQHGDKFPDPETASSLLRRCIERYPRTALEVVVE